MGVCTQIEGVFAEYLKVDGDLAWKVTTGIKDEEAVTYGVSAVTAAYGFSLRLWLEWPDDPSVTTQSGKANARERPVLIYSGATNAGLFAIQFAKLIGCLVINTTSTHPFDLVKSYGADYVFDYRSATSAHEISSAFPDLKLALDCFSDSASTSFCSQVLSERGGRVVTLLFDHRADTDAWTRPAHGISLAELGRSSIVLSNP